MESPRVSDPVVVFRTGSGVEASVVRGLLDAHGIATAVMTDMPRSVFPLAISGQWELRVAVDREVADEAQRIIESHRQTVPAGQVVRLRTSSRRSRRGSATGSATSGCSSTP